MAQEKTKPTPAQQLQELERAASLETMLTSAEPSIKDFCAAYALLLDAHERICDIADGQQATAKATKDFADNHKLATQAKPLSGNYLLAHVIARMAGVRLPAHREVDGGKFFLPIMPWLAQYDGEHATKERAHHIQRTLNDGDILIVQGVSAEKVADELMHGRDPRKLEAKFIPAVNPNAKPAADWLRWASGSRPPQTDANAR